MATQRPLIGAFVLIGCVLAVASCRRSPGDQLVAETAAPAAPAAQTGFAGKIWMSTDQAAPLGTLRIFLADGTLVMDSCFETYRIARWRSIDERRIEWQEDTARIAAEVAQEIPDVLRLRLHLVSEVKEENYRLVQVPFLCPDARAQAALMVKD